MSGIDRERVWPFLDELAERAAVETLSRFRTRLAVEDKGAGGGFDPVTEADRAAEAAMRDLIARRFPDHGILGEEGEDRPGTGPYTWILDPIDGTRSFLSGMPTWGTLIGLLEEGRPCHGMMSQPFVGESFRGGEGRAEHRGRDGTRPLATRPAARLEDATLFATAPDMFAPGHEARAFAALGARVRLTRFGADCYAYCLLAAGHVDLVVEAGLGFHDIAPLVPIVEGAGGVVTDWAGQRVAGGGQVIAAASEALLAEALAVLARAG